MNIYLLESPYVNPWQNLAIEAALADRIGADDICLYLWQNDKSVIIGKGQNALRECRGSLLENEGGFLARRSTGGGAVYQDPGNLCFTFAASHRVYDLPRQMKTVMAACGAFGIRVRLSGRNDILTEEGCKFSGNAFSIQKNCRIQHGTLMVDVDRDAMQRYLTPSPLKLKAKGIASVKSRVCNLRELCPELTTEKLGEALKTAFRLEYGPYTELKPEDLPKEKLKDYTEKYASWDWRYGRSPGCELELETIFPWGEVQVHMHLEGLVIRECRVFSDCLNTLYTQSMQDYLIGKRLSPADIDPEAVPSGADDSLKFMMRDTVKYLGEKLSGGRFS